jgi:hypothetical protein
MANFNIYVQIYKKILYYGIKDNNAKPDDLYDI